MSINSTLMHYSRTFIKYTAIETKLSIMAKTTKRITQNKNLSPSIDTTYITTCKEATQYPFMLCLIYTITG